MRVLWLVRKNLTEFPGGDTIQVIETQRALERLGVVVDRRSVDQPPTKEDAKHYDRLHLFHLDRLWENLPVAKASIKHGLPYAISTIYWPTNKFDDSARAGVNGFVARVFGEQVFQSIRQAERWCVSRWKEQSRSRLDPGCLAFDRAARSLLANASVCLPNSRIEWERLQSRFGANARMHVVPNAVRNEYLNWIDDHSASTRRGLISVGRIEPRKNQLALIRAVSNTYGDPIELTIVGSPGRFNSSYFEKCKRLAGPNVRFVPHQSVDSLRELYTRAAVHASPSWYDTPGLVNLEAGILGCSLVVGNEGSAGEYFGNLAEYSDPADPASIRAAVDRALDMDRSTNRTTSLPEMIQANFTWDHAGDATLKAYELME